MCVVALGSAELKPGMKLNVPRAGVKMRYNNTIHYQGRNFTIMLTLDKTEEQNEVEGYKLRGRFDEYILER